MGLSPTAHTPTTRDVGPNRRAYLCLVPLLLCAFSTPGVAQETPPPERLFTDRVRVDIVDVEVFVTDRQGRPVYGLGRGVCAQVADATDAPVFDTDIGVYGGGPAAVDNLATANY